MTLAPATPDLVFDRTDDLAAAGHEQVVFCRDRTSGLRAIIAIHDTRLGPALGGTRMYPYGTEAEALRDVLRLSHGMTHKAAAAGLDLGGGKAVIIGNPATLKTPELLRSYGAFVDSLSGRYYTAADVGTTAEDLDIIATATPYVTGSNGGSGDSGASTAYGVFCAARASAAHVFGETGLAGRSVAVEGVGKVGFHLVGMLLNAGARVIAADASPAALQRLQAAYQQVRVTGSALDAEADIYAPCALGATLTPESVRRLRARLVCGAANNQLLDPSVGDLLLARDITWVPDYVANAGGLIQVGGEIWNRTEDEVRHDVARIADTVTTILTRATETGAAPATVAAQVVEQRLNRVQEISA